MFSDEGQRFLSSDALAHDAQRPMNCRKKSYHGEAAYADSKTLAKSSQYGVRINKLSVIGGFEMGKYLIEQAVKPRTAENHNVSRPSADGSVPVVVSLWPTDT